MKHYLLLGLLLLSASQLKGQMGYIIGDSISNFTLTSTDDSKWSLAEQSKGVIIVFMSHSCPIAESYLARLRQLQAQYAPKGFPLVAINPNNPLVSPQDSFALMKRYAQTQDLNFPYLTDQDQDLARAFGATRTPQCFVLAKDPKGVFRLQYIGAIDDNPRDASAVKQNYLRDAVDNLLSQQAIQYSYTRASGCGIKWTQ